MRHLVEGYIGPCPTCNLSKPSHHKPYGELQPIATLDVPFATITMDFIVGLLVMDAGNDALLTVTDKFSKYVKLIPGRTNMNAKKWATKYFENIFKD